MLLVAAVVGCGGGISSMPPDEPVPPSDDRPTDAAPADDAEALARHFVQQLKGGEHELLVARFSAAMQAAMSASDLGDLWTSLEGQLGPMQSIEETTSRQAEKHVVVDVVVRFAKAPMIVQIAFDEGARVDGLFIKAPTTAVSTAPPYADEASVVTESLTVGAEGWPLPATLTLPKSPEGKCPALVLVHGSGPNDRDETVGGTKPFRDIALGLSSKGICVLRYDKRTLTHKDKIDDTITLKEETLDDAVAAVAALRAREEVDATKIYVLGHSLGGMAIPRIAAADDKIAGFIIMAGSTRKLEDIVVQQIRYIANLDGQISDKERDVIAALEKQAAAVKALTAASETPKGALPLSIPQAYWLDLAKHPPATEIAGETRPVLVLHGDRDYQVTLDDFAGWKSALDGKPNATLKRYPKLNHLFVAGEGKSTPPEYIQPGHVDAQVIADIVAWITSR